MNWQEDHSLFVTVEENVKSGGYGEHVSAYMEACHPEIRVLSAAVWDRFVPQGNVESLRSRIRTWQWKTSDRQ